MKKTLIAIISIVILLTMCSCVPSTNIGKAKSKMERKGYIVSVDSTSLPALIYAETGKQITYALVGNKDVDCIYAFLFGNKDDANEAIEYITKYGNKIVKDSKTKISGKWVYFGTKQGIKDFE